MIINDPTHRQLLNALRVITLTPHIRQYLLAHDPKSLAQAEKAIEAALEGPIKDQCASLSGDFRCDRAANHEGQHGCYEHPAIDDRRVFWRNVQY